MKYNLELIPKLEAFIAEMDESNFWKHCSIHHIACLLDVHRTTIWRWSEDEDKAEFATLIKKWEEKRNALFLEIKRKDVAWIFLAKNWLEMRDRQETEHNFPGELRVKVEKITTDIRPDE
jgi:hypothetical protein